MGVGAHGPPRLQLLEGLPVAVDVPLEQGGILQGRGAMETHTHTHKRHTNTHHEETHTNIDTISKRKGHGQQKDRQTDIQQREKWLVHIFD